jgi:hypothetical protein
MATILRPPCDEVQIQTLVPAGQESDRLGVNWAGAAPLWFTISFSGSWLGMVSAVQIFEMT